MALDQAKALARTWRAIHETTGKQADHVLARKSKLCDWCAFKPACPAHVRSIPTVGTTEHGQHLAAAGLTQRPRRDVAVSLERLDAPEVDAVAT